MDGTFGVSAGVGLITVEFLCTDPTNERQTRTRRNSEN